MSASNFTIYQLNTDKNWQTIIDEFNKDKEEDKRFNIETNIAYKEFKSIKEYSLYTRAASTIPDWVKPLTELVPHLDEIENINNSYVLFLKVKKESFVATGGQGYSVIESDKNFNFGIELLSRLIEKNESVIKSINDRHLAGNVVGGNYLYHQNVSISMEKEFNSYLSKIYTALPSETIEKKLGIEIKTKKEDYRFLAKDSIRLSKSLTLNELDTFLGSIAKLLKEKGYAINPISYINKKDPVIKTLDAQLIPMLKDYLEKPETNHGVKIVPFFNVFDNHYIQIGNDNIETYESEKDIINYLVNHLSFDKDIPELLSIIRQVKLTATIESGERIENSLYSHLEVNIMYENRTYWLRDGLWLYLERNFIDEINTRFLNNIYGYSQNFILEEINDWEKGEKEGDFNFGHNQLVSVYVLDKILYNNIEICDLLVKREDELFFVHVKDGLGGDTRILANQVEASMRTLHEGIYNDAAILENYYNSIINKIKEPKESEKESTQSRAARKFQMDFPDKDSFTDLIKTMEKNIKFVFAYRPLESHDFFDPNTIQSTPAKLAMLHLVEKMNEYNFKLEFLKIKSYAEELV